MATTRRRASAPHAAPRAGGWNIDSWNLELHDPERDGFVGDRASHTAFRTLLRDMRRRAHTGDDPFGRERDPDGDRIDHVLIGGDADAAHVVHLAVEQWARELAYVARCFLARPEWEGVERIVMGGGMPQGTHGGLAVRRAQKLLHQARAGVELVVLGHDPDEAGMLGWVPLAPASTHRAQGFLAVDIGGNHYRCGIVLPRLDRARDGARAEMYESMVWRHSEDDPDREESIDRIAGMLNALAALARTTGLKLAPFVGVACPGDMDTRGRLRAGTQNLPGDWEAPFDFPRELAARLDRIAGRTPQVAMHNDAVVQGLSEHARMRGVRRWGVFTVGTGLGNASYTRRG
jgi:hypothetical protein